MLTCGLQIKFFKGTVQDPNTFFQIPLMNAIAREISRQYIQEVQPSQLADFRWEASLTKFPHPSLEIQSILGSILAAFIFAALMFGFVSQVMRELTGGSVRAASPGEA
jgi:hypothetical protein